MQDDTGGDDPGLERIPAVLRVDHAEGPSGRPRLVVTGDLDLTTAHHVEAQLRGAFERASDVEVDLRNVRFMDSTGLGALLIVAEGGADRHIVIVDASPQVQRVIELTGLAETFGRSGETG